MWLDMQPSKSCELNFEKLPYYNKKQNFSFFTGSKVIYSNIYNKTTKWPDKKPIIWSVLGERSVLGYVIIRYTTVEKYIPPQVKKYQSSQSHVSIWSVYFIIHNTVMIRYTEIQKYLKKQDCN